MFGWWHVQGRKRFWRRQEEETLISLYSYCVLVLEEPNSAQNHRNYTTRWSEGARVLVGAPAARAKSYRKSQGNTLASSCGSLSVIFKTDHMRFKSFPYDGQHAPLQSSLRLSVG